MVFTSVPTVSYPTPGVTRHGHPASPAWLQAPAISTPSSQPSAPKLFTRLPALRPPPALPGRQQRALRGRAALSPAGPRRRCLCPRGRRRGPGRGGSEGSAAAGRGIPAGRGSRRRSLSSSAGGAGRREPRPAGLGHARAVPVLSAGPQGRQFPAPPHPQLPQARGHHRDWRLLTATAFTHGQGTEHRTCL